jgi:hypothetical protein
MSDEEGAAGPAIHGLTEEEKAAARARKAAKRAAKAASLSVEAIAEAEARRARIAEREEVRVHVACMLLSVRACLCELPCYLCPWTHTTREGHDVADQCP